MENKASSYEIIGPDEHGLIRLKMPNLDPGKNRDFYCVTLGDDKNAIAEAMVRWLCVHGYGESEELHKEGNG